MLQQKLNNHAITITILFFRDFDRFGCEKIEGNYCICFIENSSDREVINGLTRAIQLYRCGANIKKSNLFALMRDDDILNIAKFFTLYGKEIEDLQSNRIRE
jgi:hypothetical protein